MRIFRKADIVQVISNFLSTWSKNMGASSPIVVVPNGVNFSLFSNRKSENELNDLKKCLNKKDKDIFLVTTSRLVEKNATIDIIDSLTYLPENVKFLVLGTGHEEEMLKQRTKRLNLENRVIFLGFVKHEDMPKYLHVSDIFIRPSLSEGFGNSYIEAMAAGIPVIALSGSDRDLKEVDYPIPGNDASIGSISFFIDQIVWAYKEGRNEKLKKQKVVA
jgi:glycosyltransferase involved in cell wall biosynthesis